jgi:excisionase family DNA binding protein
VSAPRGRPEPPLEVERAYESDERARLPKLAVTPEEAAEMLSIGRTQVYELIRSGELDSVAFGRARRIPVDALEDLLRRRRGRPIDALTPGQG